MRLPAVLALAALLAASPTPASADAGHGPGSFHGGGHGDEVHGPADRAPADPAPAVPDDGLPPDAAGAELAQRLAQAKPGDKFVLEAAAYRGNFVVDVPVTLDGGGTAMLVSPGVGNTLTIRAPGTTVTGLHVHGSGPGPNNSPAGIRIEADDVTIADSVVHDAYMGIAVAGADGARIVGNTVTGREDAVIGGEGHAVGDDEGRAGHSGRSVSGYERGDAVWLWEANAVLVRGNRFEEVRDGVYLSFVSDALIDANVTADSRYGIHAMYARDLVVAENIMERNLSGLVLMYGGPLLVLRNRVSDSLSQSTGFGILLKDVVGAEVAGNALVRNRVGLHLDGPTGAQEATVVSGNTVAFNQVGAALYPSAKGTFRANSFHENTIQVLARGRGVASRNTWADRGLGNYWSSYRGYDAAGAGVGAVPHREGQASDRILGRAPVLHALASSPALRLLRTVEDRWVRSTPVLVDELPLTRPVAHAGHQAPTRADPAVVALGVLLLLGSLVPMLIGRPRGRRATWRLVHAPS